MQNLTLTILVFVFFTPLSLMAQDVVTPKEPVLLSNAAKVGWTPTLSLTGNLSFGSNNDVIGQQNGDTTTLGAIVSGGYSYFSNENEWRNSLKLSAATTKTPSLPEYVKSNDEFKFESIYLYSLESVPWMGPYVKVNVDSTLFKGEDVRQLPTDYLFSDRGVITANSIRLTDPFRPLTLKESVGAFAKIIDKEDMKLEARLGLGALQVKAAGQYAVLDDSTTPEIEVVALKDYEQAGVEGGLDFKGLIDEKTSYTISGEFLIPVINDLEPGDNREALELTNYEVLAKLTSKLNSWMSLDYEYKLKKQPQLLDKNQIQHIVLLNLSYVIY